MKQIVFEVEESPEGGFEAHALGHRIYTQGETDLLGFDAGVSPQRTVKPSL